MDKNWSRRLNDNQELEKADDQMMKPKKFQYRNMN